MSVNVQPPTLQPQVFNPYLPALFVANTNTIHTSTIDSSFQHLSISMTDLKTSFTYIGSAYEQILVLTVYFSVSCTNTSTQRTHDGDTGFYITECQSMIRSQHCGTIHKEYKETPHARNFVGLKCGSCRCERISRSFITDE